MFSCCCANKKALKKASADKEGLKENLTKEDKKNPLKSPKTNEKSAGVDENFCKSPIQNDKSNSSDEENNLSRLSGLILSDGLVGENCAGKRSGKFMNPIDKS